jgi:hypothetical protein
MKKLTYQQKIIDLISWLDTNETENNAVEFDSMVDLIEHATLIAEHTDKNVNRIFTKWKIGDDFYRVEIHPINKDALFTISKMEQNND